MTTLAIVADTQHYVHGDDVYVLAPVAAQLERLASLFDGVVACVPVYPGEPPTNFEAYLRGRVRVVPLAPAGGTSVRAKLTLAVRALTWIPWLRLAARRAGFIHFRCPCNVALVGLLVVPSSLPWYAMYAGSWEGYPGEPWSYRLQRRLLRRRRNGVVTAYTAGVDPDAAHVVPFFSPTHTAAELATEAAGARPKIDRLLAGHRPSPLRVISVGHLNANKNHATTIRAVHAVRGQGADVTLDIAGTGPLHDDLARLIVELGMDDAVILHGLLPRRELLDLYRGAHVNVLVSHTEGYPKVVLEGMAAGVVPVIARFSMAAEMTGHGRRGATVASNDVEGLTAALLSFARDPQALGRAAEACLQYASEHSLESFRDELATRLRQCWPALFSSGPEPRPTPPGGQSPHP